MTHPREHILCAAIHYDDGQPHAHQPTETGWVVCGHRHHHVINTVHDTSPKLKSLPQEQGFLTDKPRFVSRRVAHRLAWKAGQTKVKPTMASRTFTSEDLY